MKRLGFFAVWTLAFWLFAMLLGGRIAVMAYTYTEAANPTTLPPRDFRQTMEQSLSARKKAFDFWRRYWHVTLVGAILVAGAGSAKGLLPGTRKFKIVEPPPLPPAL